MQRDRSLRTDKRHRSRKFCGLTIKDILSLICSLILPLVLGVFTVITTDNQQKEATRQSNKDSLLREQESKIASEQNELQRELTLKQYQDNVLSTYTTEIGKLLEKNKGSLTSSPIIATIARAKTLNTIRQLDAQRGADVIRFLYEAKQLTATNQTKALDVATVKLSNISKNVLSILTEVGKLSLMGINLHDSILDKTLLCSIDLSSAKIDNVNFSAGELHDVNFSSSQLTNMNFSSGRTDRTSHSCARPDDKKNLLTRVIGVDFVSAIFRYVDFLFTRLQDVSFQSATLNNVRFTSARLDNVNFQSARIYNVDYSFTKITDINFLDAQLQYVNFSFADLSNVSFRSAQLVSVDFSSAILRNVNFSETALSNVHFSFSTLVSVAFTNAKMAYTNFVQTARMIAYFDKADLSMSVFWQANARDTNFYGSDLTAVNFSQTNLQRANFTGTDVTENQLQSALSIRDAQLPNGTRGRDQNLIINGNADCNTSLEKSWDLKFGNITAVMSDKDIHNCYFILQSLSTGAFMLQRINLSNVWYRSLWSYSQVILNAQMGSDVSIQLSGMTANGEILARYISSSIGTNITMRLHKAMQTLEILIEFRAQFNKSYLNNSWCDDIELFIDYGIDTESAKTPRSRGSSTDILSNAKWKQDGIAVAGGNGRGNETNQLAFPRGLYVDDNQTVYIADEANHRIIEWECGATSGKILTGNNGKGNETNQLDTPHDVIVDKERDSLIICDLGNRRVVKWPRRNNSTSGETIISDVDCTGLTMDENGFLYVVDNENYTIRRYRMDGTDEKVVAGGNGPGNGTNHLSAPWYIFVDRNSSIYVSDWENSRVMKWEEGAKEGVIVAGGHGEGSSLTQLRGPSGVVVDQLGTVYVADELNHRIMRWVRGNPQGNVIISRYSQEGQLNQLSNPAGLSFDRHGNLYVTEYVNHRVQKFEIIDTTD